MQADRYALFLSPAFDTSVTVSVTCHAREAQTIGAAAAKAAKCAKPPQASAEKWAGSSAKAPSTPCARNPGVSAEKRTLVLPRIRKRVFRQILRRLGIILRKHQAHHTALINHSAAVMRKFHGRPPSRRRSTKPPQCRPREADRPSTLPCLRWLCLHECW